MLNFFGRLVLFLSSYSPLLFVLAVKSYERPALAWALIVIGIVAGGMLPAVIVVIRSFNPVPIQVSSAESKSEDVVAYMFTYVLPIVGLDVASTADLAALMILVIVIALVFVNSSLVLINPLLAGAGFHLHRVVTEQGTTFLVLTRSPRSPSRGQIMIHKLGTNMGEMRVDRA